MKTPKYGLDDLKDAFDVVDPNELEIDPTTIHDLGLELSLDEIGLLEPPLISGKKVVEGRKRVLIAQKSGWQTLLVRRVPQHLSIIAPIQARLIKHPYTVLSVAQDVADWKQQYELENPAAKKGGDQKTKKQTGIIPFWKMLSHHTGWSQSKIENLVKIGSLSAEERTVTEKNEFLANDHVKLLHIARCQPVQKLGKTITKLDVIEGVAAHPTWPIPKIIKELSWNKPTPPPAYELIPGIPPLFCGDFEDVMMTMPEKSVQLVLTDPLWHLDWVHNLPRLTKQVHRILADDGAAIVFYCSSRVNRVSHAMDDVFGVEGFFAQIIDDQGDGTPQPFNPHGYQDKYKCAVMYCKKARTMDNTMANIFRSKKLANKGAYEFGQSLELFEYLIRFGSKNVNDTVLDCCVGGGTSMIAALNTGRKFIGIDINPNAINICKQVFAEWLKNQK